METNLRASSEVDLSQDVRSCLIGTFVSPTKETRRLGSSVKRSCRVVNRVVNRHGRGLNESAALSTITGADINWSCIRNE